MIRTVPRPVSSQVGYVAHLSRVNHMSTARNRMRRHPHNMEKCIVQHSTLLNLWRFSGGGIMKLCLLTQISEVSWFDR